MENAYGLMDEGIRAQRGILEGGGGAQEKVSGVDSIGMYGPFIAGAVAILHLWRQPKYVGGYLVGSWWNEQWVVFLKRWIKEPRPVRMVNDPNHPAYYGMPSGHAQHVAFTLVYLWLVKPSWIVSCICGVVGGITVWERVKNRRHTVAQVVGGMGLGSIIAIVSVYIIRKTLEMR
jgi:membrane-associated phospholipid phosphatase